MPKTRDEALKMLAELMNEHIERVRKPAGALPVSKRVGRNTIHLIERGEAHKVPGWKMTIIANSIGFRREQRREFERCFKFLESNPRIIRQLPIRRGYAQVHLMRR